VDQPTLAAEQLFSEQRLALAMAESDLDALVAHSSRNYFYLSGFTSLDYTIEPEAANFAVFPRDGSSPVLTIPRSDQMTLLTEPVRSEEILLTGSFQVEGYEPPFTGGAPTPREALVQALRNIGADRGRIGVESELLPTKMDKWLREQLPDATLVDASEILRSLRMVKTPEEVSRIRRACVATDAAIATAIPAVHPGMTEREVARLIARELVDRDVKPVYVQVATGAAAGLCGPSDRIVSEGDVIRADVAATFRGYHSDLGRSFAIGQPTQQQLDLYRAARHALEVAIDAVAVGATVASVFEAGLSAWHDAGYPQVRRHHIGHGIGLQAHEAPMIAPGSTALLTPGMVLAVEVPYYVFGVGGFAPEDIVVVQEDGCERFTVAPPELPIA
jgi:Xaa-Pro dipeptidase